MNGKAVEGEVAPGEFFAVTRTWKNGDRVEYQIGMPLRLQAIDPQTPQLVALTRGPIALFATGNLPTAFSRAQLLGAAAAGPSSVHWLVQTTSGKVTFRPFAAIGDETYRLYQNVEG